MLLLLPSLVVRGRRRLLLLLLLWSIRTAVGMIAWVLLRQLLISSRRWRATRKWIEDLILSEIVGCRRVGGAG